MAEAEQTLEFYVSPIANPICKDKLRQSLLKFITRCNQNPIITNQLFYPYIQKSQNNLYYIIRNRNQTYQERCQRSRKGIKKENFRVQIYKYYKLLIFQRIVVFAADISPVDVLSHLPLQCEELGIPYCYVRSRLELGAAAQTKKPTSVVLIQVPTKEDIKGLERYHQLFDKVKEINPFI